MVTAVTDLKTQGKKAREASKILARVPASLRNLALENIAEELSVRAEEILDANYVDYESGKTEGLNQSILDRLLLDNNRLDLLARDIQNVVALDDPLGGRFDVCRLPNGLRVGKQRVPLGVIGTIYESRPNVTIDISVLCIKSGNAVMLRGGRDAINSNTALVRIVQESISKAGIPDGAVQFVQSTDRAIVGEMLKLKEYIDLMIPRGSSDLIQRVSDEASMPSITGGIGVCNVYIDRAADLEKAVAIARDSKISRPSACNALDTILVHTEIAKTFLPKLVLDWAEFGVEIHCDHDAMGILGNSNYPAIFPANEEDWKTEYLSLTAAVKVVDSMEEALNHVETYGSGHTDSIVTEDDSAAQQFLDNVDSGVVLVNASTRFNDGGQLGLGAEVAISTNKLHARGPMGLKELTSYKWIVEGSGQVRR